ncbi:MAG: zeta toxin family protein [Flavobacteriales bacterium]|nr:zeta toxin family protein [Flavobacteriales bacterium]
MHFVNADLIAAGLSPLDPPAAQVAAARILLEALDRLAKARVDFAFETTLSGRTYLDRIRNWREAGYRIEIVFLRLPTVEFALRRVANRVKQGGHDVPAADVRRRFTRGLHNFDTEYKDLAHAWSMCDNDGPVPHLIIEHNG